MLLKEDRFFNIRRHILHKGHYGSRKGLSAQQIYNKKKSSRLNRADAIEMEAERKGFFDWIFDVQKKLNLSNPAFASRLGVSLQTLKLWRNAHGHYPSERSFKALLRLEKEAKIIVEEVNINQGATNANN